MTSMRPTKTTLLKVVILGDGGVGKSCLMNRFVTNVFDENSFHTIGVEFLNKDIEVDGEKYTLQVRVDMKLVTEGVVAGHWILISITDLGYRWTGTFQGENCATTYCCVQPKSCIALWLCFWEFSQAPNLFCLPLGKWMFFIRIQKELKDFEKQTLKCATMFWPETVV